MNKMDRYFRHRHVMSEIPTKEEDIPLSAFSTRQQEAIQKLREKRKWKQ